MAEKRKQTAQRHWAMIRREIQERIRKRKESNSAGKSWNILRSQVRATTHTKTVRLELYAKYGVAGTHTTIEPLEKPTISEEVKQLINTFQTLEIKHIQRRNSNSQYRMPAISRTIGAVRE